MEDKLSTALGQIALEHKKPVIDHLERSLRELKRFVLQNADLTPEEQKASLRETVLPHLQFARTKIAQNYSIEEVQRALEDAITAVRIARGGRRSRRRSGGSRRLNGGSRRRRARSFRARRR